MSANRSAKRKPCAVPLCPALRATGKYVCAVHAKMKATNGHKYGAVATVVDNIRFDSKAEAKRYFDLKLMEKAGIIRNLQRQTRWPLMVKNVVVCHYVSDFDYDAHGTPVVEDTKGMITPLYKLKAKMFEAQYGFAIREVR